MAVNNLNQFYQKINNTKEKWVRLDDNRYSLVLENQKKLNLVKTSDQFILRIYCDKSDVWVDVVTGSLTHVELSKLCNKAISQSGVTDVQDLVDETIELDTEFSKHELNILKKYNVVDEAKTKLEEAKKIEKVVDEK